jgi:hypothetical protein
VLVGVGLGMIVTHWAAQFLQAFLVHVDADHAQSAILLRRCKLQVF